MRKTNSAVKVKSLAAAAEYAARLRRAGKRVVSINGSFDVLHAGHTRLLEEAKRQGDALIVLVNSDASVQLYKGPGRPIVPLKFRMDMLAALEAVDCVTSFEELVPNNAILKIRPHVHCNGSDWGKNCVERSAVEAVGGKIHVIQLTGGLSTSALLRKIAAAEARPAPKAVFLDRDGVINDNGQGYVHTKEEFYFLPGVVAALVRLSKTPYRIIVVSNQSGIGRGYYSERDVSALHAWMKKELKKKGARVDGIYICPHHPYAGCACRKPKTGMLLQAARDFDLSLNGSWFVGDSESDVMAGRMANVKTIHIGPRVLQALLLEPNFYAKNLAAAIAIITRHE